MIVLPRIFCLVLIAYVAAAAHAAAAESLIVKQSQRSVGETIDAFQSALEEKGITVFGRIDHQANAKKAGLELPPTILLIFGNPKLGTPLMQTDRKFGIDLPMKVLVWEDPDGKVYLGYTDPDALKERHGVEGRDE